MEIRETAACGIAEREFAIDLEEDEIQKMREFVENALDAACLDTDVAKEIIDVFEEDEWARSVSLELLETEIVQLFKGLKAAEEQNVEHDMQFSEDLSAAMEHIVGSAFVQED
jgi:hypothetical protein